MSTYIQPLYDAVRAKVLTAWPDVEAAGVFEAEHIADIPWGDLKNKAPFAAIQVTSVARVQRGLANRHFQVGITVYRMQRVNGPSGRLLTQLEALRDLLLGAKLNCGPVLPMPFEMKWDEELPANAILAAKEMFYLRAGTVSFAVLVGENE